MIIQIRVDSGSPVPGACPAMRLAGEVRLPIPCGSTGIALVTLRVRAEKVCTRVFISVGGMEDTWYIPVQWSNIMIPVQAAEGLEAVLQIPDSGILLAEATVEPQAGSCFEEFWDRSGMELAEPFEEIVLRDGDASNLGVGPCTAMIKSGGYVYAIGKGVSGTGELCVCDVQDPQDPKIVSRLAHLGSVIRQLVMLETGKHLLITAREYGAFVVNVEDPAKPFLCARYDSVEMATGVGTNGSRSYIANRQLGVEILDTSDPCHPRHLANIKTGEAQSCYEADNILYVGLWSQHRVDLYDVADPSRHRLLSQCDLSGKGDGCCVRTVGGRRYLYAAVGHHSDTPGSRVNYMEQGAEVMGFGNGNGLDIFDVTDPCRPVWLSTSRIDRRFFFAANNDFWKVDVSEHEGRVYAYVCNSYTGILVLDVTDPRAPRRLAHIRVTVAPDSPNYKIQKYVGHDIFPYDQTVCAQSAAGAIALEDGKLYVAATGTDVHLCQDPKLFFAQQRQSAAAQPLPDSGDLYTFRQLPQSEFTLFCPGPQIYAVARGFGHVYAACAEDGIWILDEALQPIRKIPTAGFAMDVQLRGNKLLCAEHLGGLGVYEVENGGTELREVRHYRAPGQEPVRFVQAGSRGRYALLQYGHNFCAVIDTEQTPDGAYLEQGRAISHMYYHCLSPRPLDGRYHACFAERGYTYFYDFGEDGDSRPVQIPAREPEARGFHPTYTANSVGLNCGMNTLGGKFVSIGKNGYVFSDPRTDAHQPQTPVCTDPDCAFTGMPTIAGRLMLLSDRWFGNVYLADCSEPAKPRVLRHFQVTGSPDYGILADGFAWLPLGHQGLIRFALTEREQQLAQMEDSAI